jgi:hypothetical protein
MHAKRILFILSVIPLFSFHHLAAQDSLLHIIIVAGQSNALNWHADAQLLETSPVDNHPV